MSLVKPEDNPDPNLRTGEDVDEDNCQNSLKKFPRMERETFRAFPQPVCHHPMPPVSLSYSTVLEFVFTFVFIFPFEFVILFVFLLKLLQHFFGKGNWKTNLHRRKEKSF